MVGLHVLNNEVVGLSVAESVLEVVEPLVGKVAVNGVHDGDFAVKDHVGVVRHAVGNVVLTLKQIDFVVVNAHIADVFGDFHKIFLTFVFIDDYIFLKL